MRIGNPGITIIYLFCMLFVFGCAMQNVAPPESSPREPAVEELPDPRIEVTPEMVEEYAKIHQISDLKTAEYYLTHPAYARKNPYKPTEEDIAYYEMDFLVKMYPKFKETAEKVGFMRARKMYMENPPVGPGSLRIGAGVDRYGRTMQQLADSGGEGASTGLQNPLLDHDPAAIHYREAMLLYKKGELDKAIAEMEIAVRAKPDAPGFLYNLGVMYMEKGDNVSAIQTLKSCIGYIKETGLTKVNLAMYANAYIGATTNLGLIYTRLGMYNDAVKILKEALKFKPDDLEANCNLGTAYYVMGDFEKASEQMRRCAEVAPDNAQVHNIIGLIYYRKELYRAALDEFEVAVKLNPDEKQYSHNLGLVLAKLGRQDEANRAFANAEGLKEGAEMRRIYAEQTSANKVRKLYNEGVSAMESLNYTRAIELLEAVLELSPDMTEAHFGLGVSYGAKGNREKQIYHFKKALRLKPDMTDARYNLGVAYSDARMYPEAIAELRQAIELKPDFKEAYFSLGTALYRIEDFTAAADVFEKCLELSPNWLEARLNLGSCYMKTDDVAAAIEHFKEAIRLAPRSAEAHYDLGAAYKNEGKYDEAIALFRKALELDPAYRIARIELKELQDD
jgi:tetratricopeptide (TPR) repeat protein